MVADHFPLPVFQAVDVRGAKLEVLDLALRGPSDWSEGERELFAAFVSSLNQCVF